MADIYCIIPHFLVYKGLKSTNSVRIRFNQAEESKYEIMIPFERKKNQYGRHLFLNKVLFSVRSLFLQVSRTWTVHCGILYIRDLFSFFF